MTLEYREFFADLAAIVAATLIDEGVDADVARLCAGRVIEGVRREWGGHKPYIPRHKYTTESMRRLIRAEWDGANTHALCQQLDISDTRLRQLHDEGRGELAAGAARPE